MAHQLNDALRTKYANTTINTKGNVPAAEIKGTILNTFKLAMGLLWSQAPGIDCGGIFASVCRLQSICMMLATAAELEHEVFMLDVQTAFLRAAVEENVFVEMALGYQI